MNEHQPGNPIRGAVYGVLFSLAIAAVVGLFVLGVRALLDALEHLAVMIR